MEYSYLNKNNIGSVELHTTEPEAGVTLVEVLVTFPEPIEPKPVIVSWREPCIDTCAALRGEPTMERTLAPVWNKLRSKARLASCVPVYTWLSHGSENRLTVALSDAETPTEIAGGISEMNGDLICEVSFFTQRVTPISSYRALIRLDRRAVRYEEALHGADRFWLEQGYPYAHIPAAAREPLYSCWYSFHQNLKVPAVLEQCRLAKEYGMETVIVDDGWQTEDNSGGYAHCGTWTVAAGKIPDMRAFVDGVHQLGMKFVLWYSVSIVGKLDPSYARFADMTLGGAPDAKHLALDPRYPEVRAYLVDIYERAAREWGLDGFKLDFIDFFQLSEYTKSFDSRWDTVSLEEGVDRLLREITVTLKRINPEMLIEFRQSYIGPAIRKYGNMLRVADCPDDPLRNRVYSADMRQILGPVPVHSDMLMWHMNDTPEAVAYQMLTVLFCVPQISVLLDQISQAHRAVLRFYLSFWKKHRETLLDGVLCGDHPEALYSQVRAARNGELISVAYTDPVLIFAEENQVFFFNGTGGTVLYLHNTEKNRRCLVTIRDCAGTVVSEKEVTLLPGVHAFDVPRCGLLSLLNLPTQS